MTFTLLLSILLHVSGVAVDKRISETLAGRHWDTTSFRPDEPIAVYHPWPSLAEAGDTILVSSDLRTFIPCPVERVVVTQKNYSYVLSSSPWTTICVGDNRECLREYSSKGHTSLASTLAGAIIPSLWIILRDFAITQHGDTITLASPADTFDLCKLLVEPLINRMVVVELMDGRHAQLVQEYDRVRFDSVVVTTDAVHRTGVECFSIYPRPGRPLPGQQPAPNFEFRFRDTVNNDLSREIWSHQYDSLRTYLQIRSVDGKGRALSIQHALIKSGKLVSGSLERLMPEVKVHSTLPERDILKYYSQMPGK